MDLLKDERPVGHDRSIRPIGPAAAQATPASSAWRLLKPARQFDPDQRELIDRPETDLRMLQEELQLLERLNRRMGGVGLVLRYVERLARSTGARSLRVLDLGTGAADIPRAIVAWARERQMPLEVRAVDGNPHVLKLARHWSQDWPEISFEQHDLRQVPYAPGSFDLVLCSLALHHFSSEEAIGLLRRMQEIARLGYLMNDLRRNRLSIWAVAVISRVLSRSPIVRHDGPRSCQAAFTVGELRGLADRAGLQGFRIQRHHFVFRMVLEGTKT